MTESDWTSTLALLVGVAAAYILLESSLVLLRAILRLSLVAFVGCVLFRGDLSVANQLYGGAAPYVQQLLYFLNQTAWKPDTGHVP
jgi:hypothetical protein